MAAAIRRAWSSSPLDRLARPQQPASSNRTRHPASSSSSIAARPAAGSVKVVKESARKISSPWDAGAAGPGRRRSQRRRSCRWNRGSGRAALIPSHRCAARRAGRHPAGEIGQRERGRAQPVQRPDGPEHARAERDAVLIVVGGERLGLQRRHVHAERALALAGLALQAEVEDVVQPLVAERGPRVGHGQRLEQGVRAAPGGVLFVAGGHVRRAHDPGSPPCGTARCSCSGRRRRACRPARRSGAASRAPAGPAGPASRR